MRAAVEGRGDATTKLLAVTVLTSFDQQDWPISATPARSPISSPCASAKPWKPVSTASWRPRLKPRAVRALAGPLTILVTPGVRSAGSGKGDQKRVATPAEAIRDGANYLVIGGRLRARLIRCKRWNRFWPKSVPWIEPRMETALQLVNQYGDLALFFLLVLGSSACPFPMKHC